MRRADKKDRHLEEERGDYSLLGEAGAGEDENVLGEAGEGLAYEVPVPQKAAAGKQQGTEECSTLQHH